MASTSLATCGSTRSPARRLSIILIARPACQLSPNLTISRSRCRPICCACGASSVTLPLTPELLFICELPARCYHDVRFEILPGEVFKLSDIVDAFYLCCPSLSLTFWSLKPMVIWKPQLRHSATCLVRLNFCALIGTRFCVGCVAHQ